MYILIVVIVVSARWGAAEDGEGRQMRAGSPCTRPCAAGRAGDRGGLERPLQHRLCSDKKIYKGIPTCMCVDTAIALFFFFFSLVGIAYWNIV
jgi:hypothetical protein